MSGLRFACGGYAELARALLRDCRESCAVLFTRGADLGDHWVVADVVLPPPAAYSHRDDVSAGLNPSYLVEIANRARKEKLGVVLVHTHPRALGSPSFSIVDDEGEFQLAEYFERRVPEARHLAMVVGPQGCRARRLGAGEEISVWDVGPVAHPLFHPALPDSVHGAHDRQVRAFGAAGQAAIKRLRVGVVGAGGTGSVTAQQLAHLGISQFVLIDPDDVEVTNLNRLVGAGPADVGLPKVEIAKRQILTVNPDARVSVVRRDVVDADVAPQLLGLDFLFLCTDSHASRAVVGQIAYQYLIPCIDMGVSITVRAAEITHVTGRVQMLAPELPCLLCTGALDSEQIRREMLTPEQRAADPYVQGVHEPQPAVVSLNSTVASLAVTMFLSAVTPVPGRARFQLYDGIRGSVRPAAATPLPDCLVCSPKGALARADEWFLPVRMVGGRRG